MYPRIGVGRADASQRCRGVREVCRAVGRDRGASVRRSGTLCRVDPLTQTTDHRLHIDLLLLRLRVEDAFDVEFPDELLTKHTFCTIATIRDALGTLTEVAA